MDELEALRWVVAAGYGAAALLALRAARSSTGRERGFWLGAAVTLLLFAGAKGFHVQDAVTVMVRQAAKAGGWYAWHQDAQALFALSIGAGLATCGFGTLRWLRAGSAPAKAAAAALSLLAAFLLIRAASIHSIDSWAMRQAAGLRAGWWIELAAIAMIGVAAVIRAR